MSNNDNTLTLLSGKGGSGKTVIALSISKVLAEAGYRALLVDCDLSTHGATYFFESELEGSVSPVVSTVDLLSPSQNSKAPLLTSHGFSFIPSTVNPAEIIEPGELVSSEATERFRGKMELLLEDYDAVLFDCQAGYSPIAVAAAELARRNLIVLEPDAISSAALRVLYLQIGAKLKANNTWQIFNKLTEEERPIYEKIFGGTLFANLPPIPFDWQVRAAFATAEIPGVTSRWSAFGLGVLRVMQTLFPAFKGNLAELEDQTVGKWHRFLLEKVETLQVEKHRVQYEQIEERRRLRLRRTRLISAVALWTGAAIAGLGFLSFFRINIFRDLPVNYTSLTLAFIGGLISLLAAFYYSNWVREVRAEREQDLSQQSLAEIEKELQKYVTLVATDPQLKEYEKRQLSAPSEWSVREARR